MHITLESDYALRIVDSLARHGGRVGAKTIAEEACVTLRFSLKILRKLVASGIVRSYKGAQGGYELAKPPHEITLSHILETIEGPYYLNRCLRDGHACSRVETHTECPYHKMFHSVSHYVQQKLSESTIADMIEGAVENMEAAFETAAEDVESALEVVAEDVEVVLESAVEDVKSMLETAAEDVESALEGTAPLLGETELV